MVTQAEKDIIKALLVCKHKLNGLFCKVCRYDATKYKYDVKDMMKLKGIEPDLEDPDTFCNPIVWSDAAEEGLTKWSNEHD